MAKKPTDLLPVGTQRHGEGFYLVKSYEFEAREAQIYSLLAAYDEACEKVEDDTATIARLHAELSKLRATHETVKGNLSRLYETIDTCISRYNGTTTRLESDYTVLKTNIMRAIGAT